MFKKNISSFLRNVKTTPGEFKHAVLVADIDKKIMNVVRKTHCELNDKFAKT